MSENLATRVGAIIANSIQEESYAEGTLQRMALRNRRLGDTGLADRIDHFVKAAAAQLEFFRTIKSFPHSDTPSLVQRVQSYVRNRLSNELLTGISYQSPFELIEGLSNPEKRNLNQLSGPFFMAAVGDFSEGQGWSPQNRNYLFTTTNRPSAGKDEFELRVFNDADFKDYISGKYGQHERYTVSLAAKPQAEGCMNKLFENVVEDMAKFAFGPKASNHARDAFHRAVENYVASQLSPEISQLITVEASHPQTQAALGDVSAPALSMTGSR